MYEDFQRAKELSKPKTNTFASLLMAAIRKADTEDLLKLQKAFPALVAETIERGNDANGMLPGESN